MKLKKFASILLTLCLIITMMPLAVFADDESDRGWGDSLYVLGVQVTNANSKDVLGDGKVSYDRNTKTLTLNNAELDLSKYRNTSADNNYACGINAWSEITINLIGTNSIIVSVQSEVYNSKEYVYGIMAEDALTLTGSGSLSINIDKPGTGVLKYYGIDSSRKLTVDGSTVEVTMGVEGTEGGNGISSTYQGFELKNNASVTADGGNLTAVYDRSFGKSSVEEGSGLMTRSDSSAFKYYILSEAMKEGALVSNDKTGANKDAWDKQTDLTTYKYVEFEGKTSRAAGRLLINGREVTGSGVVDPDHDYHTGTIMFDEASNTLTLTEAVLDLDKFYLEKGNIVAGIYATGDLAIVLSGNSKILLSGTGYNQGNEPKEFINGIECWGTLTITGGNSDSLSIELGKNDSNGKCKTCGIDADDGMTVDGVSLDVNVGPYGNCNGLYLWCPIIAENGANISVVAEGTSNKGVTGTNDIGKTVISADSVLEMTATGEKGVAFDCWTPGEALKASGALVNENPTADGAYEWDKSSRFPYYKYVRIPYDPGSDGSDELTPAAPETPAAQVVAAALKDNPLAVSGKSAKVKYSKLRKKSQSLAVTKLISFSGNGEGAMAYSIASAKKEKGKKSFKKYFKINSMTGKVTVKKKLRKGTYKVKINVSAAGNEQYKPSDIKTVTVKIRVK